MELTDLYREVILDHNRHPRNFGRLDPHDGEAKGHNPLCGDRLTLTLRREGDRIADLRFEGNGCAISMASASLMTEAVKGRSRAEVDALFARVHALLTEQGAPADGLGKLAALSGVREFPARVKCASLCWHTLNAALAGGDTVSTE
ncbi:MAG: SUF system NifU family Fe-S cluster assembly protein [Pseudomonadota bacterium]|jgi:nitrogen fixation NifU-like protein|nr:MAG: SUF system NifU family Fe-S cluster assembly protein [Pseudomonadota bacterium]